MILLVGLALGVRVHGGVAGVVVLVAAALVSMVFSGVSHGIALLARREATTIAASNFVGLPLMLPLHDPSLGRAPADVGAVRPRRRRRGRR